MVVWAVELISAVGCIYIYNIFFFGCQEWLAWATNPVGGGVGQAPLHVSAGQTTNIVSWLASLAPPFVQKVKSWKGG